MAAGEFVQQMIEHNVLQFGDFVLKSGIKSPYFFNLGAIDDGDGLVRLGAAYAVRVLELPSVPDVIFGPAYKGIPIAVATAVAMARDHSRSVGVAFNRKEAKAHGERGSIVGAPLQGKVLIIDDVITAGTAVREAYQIIVSTGAQIAGLLISLDRQERGQTSLSAVQELRASLDIPIVSIVQLGDLVETLEESKDYAEYLEPVITYRRKYGVIA